ncbi:MAG: type I restriction enzyme HsdR N-terminal domain-containing protein [Flavobacteriales bacterium]|nr:type I restriction enzyme HsdR N-terminal domain-containing protein [Flavobacteriales bacterium]
MNELSLRCLIRKRDVVHSPEEEVRQRILHYMVKHLGYPAGLIAVEQSVRFNTMVKRADIIVHDRSGSPWMIVECKRPSEKLDQKTFTQISMYDYGLQAPYLMISNGNENHILRIDREENSVQRLPSMPAYP